MISYAMLGIERNKIEGMHAFICSMNHIIKGPFRYPCKWCSQASGRGQLSVKSVIIKCNHNAGFKRGPCS